MKKFLCLAAVALVLILPSRGISATQEFKGNLQEGASVKAITLGVGTNLVTNGAAWTGASGATPPTGWATPGAWNPGVHTIFDSGDGAPYDVCLKLAVNAVPNANPGITFSFTTVAGKVYVLSYAHKNGDGTAIVYAGTTADGGEYYYSGGLNDAAWTTHAAIFAATSTTAYVSLRNVNGTAAHYELFDTVSVSEISMKVNGDIYLTGNARIVIPTFANNAAAIAGGLVAGQLYRVNAATDPEPLYIVH